MPFLDEVVVQQQSKIFWVVKHDLRYEARYEPFVVPAGFVTDLATVPRLVAWLIPRYGVYTRCAVLHDYLCEEAHAGRFKRADADGIFRRSMREPGVGVLRRYMMWCGVRGVSFMSGASLKDWLIFLPLTLFSLVFVTIPAVAVQVWLVVFRLLETVVWAGERLLKGPGLSRPAAPQPRSYWTT